MAGFRRGRDSNSAGYVFVDGRAVPAGQGVDEKRVAAPGEQQAPAASRRRLRGGGVQSSGASAASSGVSRLLDKLDDGDALDLRDDSRAINATPASPSAIVEDALAQDRKSFRTKVAVLAVVLAAVTFLSLCISESKYFTFNSPVDVICCIGSWFQLMFVRISNYTAFAQVQSDVLARSPMYYDVLAEVLIVIKYLVCGAMLALSGMLYQNVFRNPIAAPSMLGVTNGINLALLILVLQLGLAARSRFDLYYLYAYIGGAAILALVIFGSKAMSGRGSFSVVNMILIGTVLSQMIALFIQYVETAYMTADVVYAYGVMQMAAEQSNAWTFATLGIGLVVSMVPIIALRFRLNLVSFSDDEARLLGVNPNRMRVIALVCGSVMILTAQVNAGQVAMASLVVPFIARAVFGAEFRKQLVGCILIGALVLLICGDVVNFVVIYVVPLDLGSVVTVLALPLFVWMLVVQQRSWE